MRWVPPRYLNAGRLATVTGRSTRTPRTPLTAPRRQPARATPAWSRRAACERRPLRRVACVSKRW